MQPYKLLSIDESGKAAYTHPSRIFILSGVVISEKLKSKIDSKMRRIKKKYFDDEEVVFHGRDMARHGGDFTVLRDSKTEISFWTEFVKNVNYSDISLYFVVTDKEKAKKAGWQPHTILRRSYLRILSEFVRNIKREKFCGKIVNESDAEEDALLIYAHNRLQVQGTGDGFVSAAEYKKMITSLSLVNKANLDIDVQIADAVAFVGRLKYEIDILKQKRILTQADKIKYRLINRKVNGVEKLGLFEVLI